MYRITRTNATPYHLRDSGFSPFHIIALFKPPHSPTIFSLFAHVSPHKTLHSVTPKAHKNPISYITHALDHDHQLLIFPHPTLRDSAYYPGNIGLSRGALRMISKGEMGDLEEFSAGLSSSASKRKNVALFDDLVCEGIPPR